MITMKDKLLLLAAQEALAAIKAVRDAFRDDDLAVQNYDEGGEAIERLWAAQDSLEAVLYIQATPKG